MIPEKMKALVIVGDRAVEMKEVSTPVPAAGEVLVKLEKCLLCTWEQRVYTNGAGMKMPFIPGHEVSGTVAVVPDDTITSFKVGDPVVVKTLDNCGHCEFCYTGNDNLCTGKSKKRFYDGIPGTGGLAQYIALDVTRVFALPNSEVDLEEAAFAEPVACCLRSLEHAKIQMGEDVVIVGGGIMGQLHNILAKKQGARTILVEIDEKRAALAKEMGADEVINPLKEDPFEKIKQLTNGRGAHVIFLTVTMTKLAEDYIAALGKMGRIIYYGSFHPVGEISIDPNHIHYSEKLITGSYSPTIKAFYTATRLLSYRLIDVVPFISERYTMAEAKMAFERAISGDTYRVLIDLWK